MATKNMTKTNTKPKTTQVAEDNEDIVEVVETKTKTITDNKKKFSDDDLIHTGLIVRDEIAKYVYQKDSVKQRTSYRQF